MEFEKIRAIVAQVLNIDADMITSETKFEDDLGADSLDLFQIITEIEMEFSISIAPEAAEGIVTIGDAVEALNHPNI
ncbi:MAG: acyl carrier protein [Lachnospiraceae bacterium]|nr:acyl carrier protein [Lachnospiraceae bacterium]